MGRGGGGGWVGRVGVGREGARTRTARRPRAASVQDQAAGISSPAPRVVHHPLHRKGWQGRTPAELHFPCAPAVPHGAVRAPSVGSIPFATA